jgi:hypothetical protein
MYLIGHEKVLRKIMNKKRAHSHVPFPSLITTGGSNITSDKLFLHVKLNQDQLSHLLH